MPLVRSGLDVLVAERAAFLRGRRIALVAHQASVDARLRHAAPLLAGMRGVTLSFAAPLMATVQSPVNSTRPPSSI